MNKMANTSKSAKSPAAEQGINDSFDKIMGKVDSMDKKEKIAHLEEKVATMKKNVEEKAAVVKKKVDGYIKNNPEKAVLIAAGVGAVIGGIIGATIMRKK